MGNIGLHDKYKVYRTDGSSGVGRKHYACGYFVLDLDHDPHARAALFAYAQSCAADSPALAADLIKIAPTVPRAAEAEDRS